MYIIDYSLDFLSKVKTDLMCVVFIGINHV